MTFYDDQEYIKVLNLDVIGYKMSENVNQK